MLFPLLTDLLFPKTSLTGTEGVWITEREKQDVERTLHPLLLHEVLLRKQHLGSIDAIVAATTYGASPLLKQLLHLYKFRRIQELHPIFVEWMQRAIPGLLIPPTPYSYPVLCPVPLHWTRRYWRGFNQSDFLAEGLARRFLWENRNLLTRTRPTGHQSHRTRDERLVALSRAFAWTGDGAKVPEWVVLIDDVCTTGTTLNECAKVLKKEGVTYVSALVFAYG